MEMLSSSILGDLVTRSISFMIDKYGRRTSAEENLQRLHQLLLRGHTIVEEAEGRHVTNQGMLRQLKILRDEMFRGCYLLDTFRYKALQEEAKDEKVSHSFALSRFNPAKRLRFPTSNSQWMVFSNGKVEDLQKMVHSLEVIIADMKEFIIFLMRYPPMHHQPYSVHLFLDKCMFGRYMEREQVIEFLLQTEPSGSKRLVDVLPIIGPAQIGKSTLVEHACIDERVRNHFSLILLYNGNALKDETPTTLRDSCTIKHQNHASHKRLLLIIELSGNVDEATWRRLYSSERCLANGSKIIITSRSDKISTLGTTQALRLRPLPCEAYWYFFKIRVFESTDPKELAKLASIAMEISNELRGSFLYGNVIGGLLRTNFNIQFWRRVLTSMREYMQKNLSSFGEYPDDIKMEDRPLYAWRIAKPTRHFLLYGRYQRGPLQDEVPEITVQDMLSGKANARDNCEILLWKSKIPPYYYFVSRCVT